MGGKIPYYRDDKSVLGEDHPERLYLKKLKDVLEAFRQRGIVEKIKNLHLEEAIDYYHKFHYFPPIEICINDAKKRWCIAQQIIHWYGFLKRAGMELPVPPEECREYTDYV